MSRGVVTVVMVEALESTRLLEWPLWTEILFDCARVVVGDSIRYLGRFAISGDDKLSVCGA